MSALQKYKNEVVSLRAETTKQAAEIEELRRVNAQQHAMIDALLRLLVATPEEYARELTWFNSQYPNVLANARQGLAFLIKAGLV